MSGGVDDIYFYIPVLHGDIFGKNGDSAFAFQVVVIQKTVVNFLIGAKNFGLFEDLIDQRGFSVVDVGNNCYIAD